MNARPGITREQAEELFKLRDQSIEATVHAGAAMRMAGETFDSEVFQRVVRKTECAAKALYRIREILLGD